MSATRIRLLGPVEFEDAGRIVPIGRRQLRIVLAVLGLEGGRSVSNDHLIDALWGDDLPADPFHALHVYVSRLRRLHPRLATAIETVPGGYRLASFVDVDVENFEALAMAARASVDRDPATAIASLDAALALWRGPAFGDLHYEEFASAAVRRLDELRKACREDRCRAQITAGRRDEAVPPLLEAVDSDPLRDRGIVMLLDTLAAEGRHSEAKDIFERYREGLMSVYGLEPSPSVVAVAAAVLGTA